VIDEMKWQAHSGFRYRQVHFVFVVLSEAGAKFFYVHREYS
jgi:hypothetical protein